MYIKHYVFTRIQHFFLEIIRNHVHEPRSVAFGEDERRVRTGRRAERRRTDKVEEFVGEEISEEGVEGGRGEGFGGVKQVMLFLNRREGGNN